MPYMYMLQCCDGTYYVGSTWDLERRWQEHQHGLSANHTRTCRQVTLVYCEECSRIDEAYQREK